MRGKARAPKMPRDWPLFNRKLLAACRLKGLGVPALRQRRIGKWTGDPDGRCASSGSSSRDYERLFPSKRNPLWRNSRFQFLWPNDAFWPRSDAG